MYDLNSCRVCLIQTEASANKSIFKTDSENKEIAEYLELLGGIKINRGSQIAQSICDDCFFSLGIAQRFRNLCQTSDKLLKKFVITENLINIKTEKVEFVDPNRLTPDDFDDIPNEIPDDNDNDDIENPDLCLKVETLVTEEAQDDGSLEDNDTATQDRLPSTGTKPPKRRTGRKAKPKEIHMCELCGNIFLKRCQLALHMRRHNNDRTFECEICHKMFLCHSELARHMRVHTGAKPFACKYCDRKFSDRSTNIKHERTHTNERPFVCDTCGKAFTYSNVLKNHILTHTGEKKFECKPCSKVFSRPHQLKQHFGTLTHQQTAFKAVSTKTDVDVEECTPLAQI